MGNCLSCFKNSEAEPCMPPQQDNVENISRPRAEPSTTGPSQQDIPTKSSGSEICKKNEMEDNTSRSQAEPPTTSSSRQSPTLEKLVEQFKSGKYEIDVDDLINAINALLQSKISKKNDQDNRKDEGTSKKTWASFIKSGSDFLKFVNDHMKETNKKEDFFHSIAATKIASDILDKLGNIHWMVGGLSIIAYLLQKIDKVSDNRSECLELLKYMLNLAHHIKKLSVEIPEEGEKLKITVLIIVEECIKCAAQLKCKKFSRFLKTSVDSETLGGVQKKINQLYPDLILTTITALKHDQPVMLPISPPGYPSYAVGIEEREQEVIKLLATTTDDHKSRAVVIYGLGGIGKTTLAKAVLAKLSLKDYNYARVGIDIDPSKNDFKSLQQIILKDGFPKYEGGKEIKLRDCDEGRLRLTEAFKSESERSLFLFIDNALRAEDLEQLLPTDLGSLHKGSRILVTTRLLGETDMFKQYGLPRFDYPVNTLPEEDALKILCKDSQNLQHITEEDRKRFLKICGGIPLVLKVAGAQLAKMGYNTEQCRQLFEDLEKGENVKQENLTSSVIDFVYDKLEKSAQEAFLDICCFFSNWNRRRVEYIVGSQQFKSIQEAALLTTFLPMSVAEIDMLTDVLDVEEEKLIVHDVIRAKGLSMSKSTRFMDLQSFTEVAEDKKQLREIKGISLGKDRSEYVFEEGHLDSMRNSLRVLALGRRMKASGQSQMKFNELRYLKLNADIPLPPLKLEQLGRLSVYQGPISSDANLLYKASALFPFGFDFDFNMNLAVK
ncbi:hypothetical protein KI387_035833 [Taxus chinensis]|uniref:AAA+ ATPase domain-containing protein n=1 Tax=Taxus chinensis TaxID=29808 RepID=A0AA38FNK6_TAXCH|nr:hypothetical protein KI387_035833 [Taxus chinensis]